MNRLDALYEVTMKLYHLLNEPVPAKDRETVIKQVNELIEQRGNLLQDIIPPFTEKEKKIGEEIVLFNEHIQKQMHVLFNELKGEMKQVKKQKKSNRTYTNPYKKIGSVDGMFMDSKK